MWEEISCFFFWCDVHVQICARTSYFYCLNIFWDSFGIPKFNFLSKLFDLHVQSFVQNCFLFSFLCFFLIYSEFDCFWPRIQFFRFKYGRAQNGASYRIIVIPRRIQNMNSGEMQMIVLLHFRCIFARLTCLFLCIDAFSCRLHVSRRNCFCRSS